MNNTSIFHPRVSKLLTLARQNPLNINNTALEYMAAAYTWPDKTTELLWKLVMLPKMEKAALAYNNDCYDYDEDPEGHFVDDYYNPTE